MAEESISLSEGEVNFLKALHDQKVEFLIVGLSAALLQGVPAVTQDIDLWIKDLGKTAFLEAVAKCNAIYIPPAVVGSNPPLLASPDLRGFDLVTDCQGLSGIDEELKNAMIIHIHGIPIKVLPLDRIIKSKEAVGREKDKAVLPILKAALAAFSLKPQ